MGLKPIIWEILTVVKMGNESLTHLTFERIDNDFFLKREENQKIHIGELTSKEPSQRMDWKRPVGGGPLKNRIKKSK